MQMDYSQFLELFNRYVKRLRVAAQPYSARHSGASIDRATHERPLDVVRKRGRWKQMASVVRYDKTGRVNDAWRALSAATRSHFLEAERRLVACLVQGAELPPSPA